MNNDAAREWYWIATAQFGLSNAPNGWVEEDDPIDIDPLLAEEREAYARHIYSTLRGGL
tara:strand:+ start:1901 stop:2077 length:177 start_codon:yes stop_codon:yes gene_type:complete